MSCAVCFKKLGDTYVVNSTIKMHRICENDLSKCPDCRKHTKIGKECMLCDHKEYYNCNRCDKKLVSGTMTNGFAYCAACNISNIEKVNKDKNKKYPLDCVIIGYSSFCEKCRGQARNGKIISGNFLCSYCESYQ
jgi:hypothetical protein